MARTSLSPMRDTYRHGDLRRALIEVGLELARVGGPDAVVLREATRRAGVSSAAAYRHFADHHALLHAVCSSAISAVAIAMEEELAALPHEPEPVAAALVYSARAAEGLATLASRASLSGTLFISISARVADRLATLASGKVLVAATPHEEAMFDLLAGIGHEPAPIAGKYG